MYMSARECLSAKIDNIKLLNMYRIDRLHVLPSYEKSSNSHD